MSASYFIIIIGDDIDYLYKRKDRIRTGRRIAEAGFEIASVFCNEQWAGEGLEQRAGRVSDVPGSAWMDKMD